MQNLSWKCIWKYYLWYGGHLGGDEFILKLKLLQEYAKSRRSFCMTSSCWQRWHWIITGFIINTAPADGLAPPEWQDINSSISEVDAYAYHAYGILAFSDVTFITSRCCHHLFNWTVFFETAKSCTLIIENCCLTITWQGGKLTANLLSRVMKGVN